MPSSGTPFPCIKNKTSCTRSTGCRQLSRCCTSTCPHANSDPARSNAGVDKVLSLAPSKLLSWLLPVQKGAPPPASAAALVHSKLHLAVLGGGARRLLHIGPGLEDLPPALACWRIVRLPVCLRLLRPVFLVLPLPLKVLACHTERGKALRISRIALHLVSCRSVLQNTEERISDSQNCMAPCELQECIPKHSRNVGFGVSQSRDVGISSTRKHSEHSGLLCGLDGKRMRRPV